MTDVERLLAEGVCSCGHVEDEHEANGTCSIEGCYCAGWEDSDE